MSLTAMDIIPATTFSLLNTRWWQPNRELQPWIQCIWSTPAQISSPVCHPDKLYPDGGASLIFEFHRHHQGHCFYYYNTKTITHAWDLKQHRISVRLQAGTVAKLLHPDFLDMTNVLVPLNDQLLPSINLLLENLQNRPLADRIQRIQTWLLARTSDHPKEVSKIKQLVTLMKGQAESPYLLADKHGMSRRTLERHLRSQLGITPKQLHDFNRTLRARNLLISSPLSLSDIALQSGYYDQAHFTNAFQASNHETPGQYRHRKMSQISKAD